MSKTVERSLKVEGDINITEQRKEWNRSLPKESRDLLLKDDDLFIHQTLSTPCLDIIESAEGATFTTVEGREVIDFHGNNVHQVGYGNSYVVDAIIEQMQRLPFSPRRYANKPAIDLAQKLTDIAPGSLNRVLFAPGGTSANSMALKLARLYSGKHKVISMWGSFHGAGLDTISVGGEAVFRKGIGPLMSGVVHIPPPVSYRGLWVDDSEQSRYIEYMRYVMEHEGDIGAIIAETVRDTDVQLPVASFWRRVRELCDEYGVLLILDEIPIALGRTGKMFAFENYGIIPDIVTIGKGLGGGIMPIAALLVRDGLNCASNQSIGHFTHEKSPVAAAAALATIEFIEKESILEKVKLDEVYMREQLLNMKERYNIIGDIRGVGLLWGIELVKDRDTKERAVDEAESILYRCLRDGLSFKVSGGNVLTLSPSLIIDRSLLKKALHTLESAIAEADRTI